MNVAGCTPSKEAPSTWDEHAVATHVREEILRTDPEVVALQEFPGDADTAERHFDGYRAVGAKHAHADRVVLLAREGIEARRIESDGLREVPAVVAELSWNEHGGGRRRRLLVCGVHLAPFKSNASLRARQMEGVLAAGTSVAAECSPSGRLPLIIAGDTNMRGEEDAAMEGGSFKLSDAWKANGSDAATEFTWDTLDHGSSFNRYYGDGTREYTARYDRVYFKTVGSEDGTASSGVGVEDVSSFDLIANGPITSKYHFLSDHFGVSTVLKIRWGD